MTKEIVAIESDANDRPRVQLPTSSKRIILLGLFFVALFFGGLGTWMALAEIQGAVIAPGEVIVESYRKQVQHLDGGIVQEILVREGDLVQKGQALIRLDGERVLASRDLYRGQMDALLAREARLVAEKERKERIGWPDELLSRTDVPEVDESMKTEEEVFISRRASKESQQNLYRAQIVQLKSQIQGQKDQLRSIENTIASLKEEIAAKTPLLEGRYLDRSHIMELERALNSHQVRRDELKSAITLATERIEELNLKIEDLETRYIDDAMSKLAEARQEIMDLRERLRPAEDACRRLEITAPESGVVVNLNVRTEGGVIQGGQPLMEIVPRDSGLIVSAMVAPDKIDDVKTGQRASVSLSAFPMRYTPKVDGTVTYVSADRVEIHQQNIPPHYLVYVQLDPESLNNAIEDVTRLTPGMPAEVYIQTEAKTVLDYILSPITESMNRALRE
jgi:HlyD family type I secretion membrane fusion protein